VDGRVLVGALKRETMELKDIIGFAAGFGTTFAALPDLIAMLRRRSSVGINPRMAAIMGSFQVLWVWYGLMIGSNSVIKWNVIAICVNALTVGAYFYFSRAEKRASAPQRTQSSEREALGPDFPAALPTTPEQRRALRGPATQL
jgi:uncharacterized protein with PQ loop repeat